MTLSTDITEVAQAIEVILESTKATTGLQEVYYGPEDLLPTLPAATVEAGSFIRELDGQGSTHKWALTMEVIITIAHVKVGESETTQLEMEQTAKRVVDAIHADKTLGGLVIFGFCTAVRPGRLLRGTDQIRSHRVMWEGYSREIF